MGHDICLGAATLYRYDHLGLYSGMPPTRTLPPTKAQQAIYDGLDKLSRRLVETSLLCEVRRCRGHRKYIDAGEELN